MRVLTLRNVDVVSVVIRLSLCCAADFNKGTGRNL